MLRFEQFEMFAQGSALDFSALNHTPAGKYGFVHATPDGHLAFENGQRIKFFGINLGHTSALCDKETAVRTAEDLARAGMNMARIHHVDGNFPASLIDYSSGNSQTLALEYFDRLDYLIYQLKQRGIYLHIDLCTRRTYLEGDGFSKEEIAQLVHFIKSVQHYDERIIALQKKFIKQYLCHYNPYTGLRYIDDPAVAVVQYVNENSIFWDNYPTRAPLFAKMLDKRFNAWLLRKYGSRKGLDDAWTKDDGTKALAPDENPESGTVRRPELGDWAEPKVSFDADYTSLQSPARHADHIAFLEDTGEANVRGILNYFDELGVRCVRNYSNLPGGTADLRLLSMADVTEHNAYWNHPEGGFIVPVTFSGREMSQIDMSALPNGFSRHSAACLACGAVAGKPFIVTEWCCCYPTKFRADTLLQLASYGALQDWDGFLLFAYTAAGEVDSPIRGFFDVRSDPAVWSFVGVAASIFREERVQKAKQTIEIGVSENDRFQVPKDYGMLAQNAVFVSRVRTRFLTDGGYEGDADIAISSGHTASGDYTRAKHAIVHSVTPYGDPYQRSKERDVWLGKHTESYMVSCKQDEAFLRLGNRICTAEFPDGSGILGHRGHEVIQTAMTKWGLLKDGRGYTPDGHAVSDTGEIDYAYKKGIFILNTPTVKVFGGYTCEGSFAGDIRLRTENSKAAFVIFAKDGLPLERSEHMLISAVGVCENSNEVYNGNIMLDAGSGPVLFDDVRGVLSLPNRQNAVRVFALRFDGARSLELPVFRKNGTIELELGGYIRYELLFQTD